MDIPQEKGHACFQAKKCVVPDDVRLASVRNHISKIVSNYRRCRKCSRKGQEKRTAACEQNVMSLFCALQYASHLFMANNPHSI
ncbi:hypothetical protein TNCV_4157061 [Trichonephila clavipes]|nr:hypothetical protein TNCV_4157061 [Trichonephila clavipes]